MAKPTISPLKRLRLEAGLTQEQLGVKARSTKQTVSMLENGVINGGATTWIRIARVLSEALGRQVTLDELLEGVEVAS
jgi:transcriptional regulator with XRE-family HTH domain